MIKDMKELEVKYIAPYLPYNLQVEYKGKVTTLDALDTTGGAFVGENRMVSFVNQRHIKSILRPLSSMSKEDVLRDLQGMLALTPLGDRKGRSEILKSIADLMRYKDEIVEGTSDSKKYYLPKKCYHCEWYKGREKDKIL